MSLFGQRHFPVEAEKSIIVACNHAVTGAGVISHLAVAVKMAHDIATYPVGQDSPTD
ncbi:hypothetical protein D9M68_552790 [compost metagenome]